MKKGIIKIIKLGYYHPSNANWNYGIHLIIDKTGARAYKETFGGDSRMIEKLKGKGIEVERITGNIPYACYKWQDVKDLLDIEKYEGKNWVR
ncbi:MAG: hypothetical protein LRZ94_00860 [Candidatus Pacebacteria bacterium]|nr:hypothetical protein [Candidatus Paceibacterota bacterium]